VRRSRAAVFLPLLLLLPALARADERFDHRGAVGLLLGGGGEFRFNTGPNVDERGLRGVLDLGGTWAIGYNGNELLGWVRAAPSASGWGWSAVAGYRGYYGYERLRTFVDLDLAAQFRPLLTAGVRVGAGVQYEITSNVGVFVGVGLQLGGGNGVVLSGEVISGLQLRSYLLE